MNATPNILINGVLDFAPIGIIVFDDNFNINYVNESFFSFNIAAAFSKDELISKSVLKDRKVGLSAISKSVKNLQEGESFESELKKLKSTGGHELQIVVKGTPVYDENVFKGGILVVEDIKSISTDSDGKYDKQSLLKTLSPIADLIFISDLSGGIVLSSDSKKIQLKKPAKNIKEIFGIESGTAITKLLNQLKENKLSIAESNLPLGQVYEESLVNIKIIRIGETNSNSVLVIIKDVTAELEAKISAENELNELRRYQAITSTIVDAVIGISYKGEIKFWNESSEKVFGYSKSQVYGKFISIIFESLNEDYFQILREELLEKRHWEGELKVDRGEGNEEFFNVRMGVTGEEPNQSFVILCSSITERTIFERELR